MLNLPVLRDLRGQNGSDQPGLPGVGGHENLLFQSLDKFMSIITQDNISILWHTY